MTTQDTFTTIVTHLRMQKVLSQDVITGKCLYRGPGGLKCSVGRLIPDAQYTPDLEEIPLSEVVHRVPALQDHNFDLLRDMQEVHDLYNSYGWEHQFRRIANIYQLEVPE